MSQRTPDLSPPDPANPLDPQDLIGQYCFEALAKTIRELKCHSGWLALLDEDGSAARQVFTILDKRLVRISPPRLESSWIAAVQAGMAQTVSNYNPFTRRVVVPYYSGDKPVLLYVLAGRIWPFNTDDIAHIASMGKETWGELERMRYISQLEQAYEMTIQGWARSLEEREHARVPGHYHLAAEWAVELGRAMHLSNASVNDLRRGAVLHDIGKMLISEKILQKSGSLSPEEWAIVRRHPILGAEMIAGTLFLSDARDVILYHHERWDGKGYPNGLKGEEIPLLARIFSVVDVFDALIVDRPYSAAWPRDMALAYIRQEASQQFDPAVVDAFIAIVKTLRMKV
jgi:putative nucleotidyltransferase with HDIG domain